MAELERQTLNAKRQTRNAKRFTLYALSVWLYALRFARFALGAWQPDDTANQIVPADGRLWLIYE